jgi:hypothetical protein
MQAAGKTSYRYGREDIFNLEAKVAKLLLMIVANHSTSGYLLYDISQNKCKQMTSLSVVIAFCSQIQSKGQLYSQAS